MNLLKIPADDSLLQEQHFLIRKAIPRQKDVNENSNERVRAHNGERAHTHTHIDRRFRKKCSRGKNYKTARWGGGGSEKKGNKNKKSVCGDYKNRADARAGLAIVVNQNEASSSRNISIFVNSHTDGRTDGRSDGGDPERERERSNKAKEARSIYILYLIRQTYCFNFQNYFYLRSEIARRAARY